MTLKDLIQTLLLEIQREVRDFAEYLLQKRAPRKRRAPAFKWAGVLRGEKGKHSSVELQHKILASRSRHA